MIFGLEFYAFRSEMYTILKDTEKMWTKMHFCQNRSVTLNVLNAIRGSYIAPITDPGPHKNHYVASYNLIINKEGIYTAKKASRKEPDAEYELY